MGNSYSFIELADSLLMLGQHNGNATDAIRRCREKYSIGKRQIVVLSFLLTADPERRKDFM
jgi:hypothetical protein